MENDGKGAEYPFNEIVPNDRCESSPNTERAVQFMIIDENTCIWIFDDVEETTEDADTHERNNGWGD